MKMRRPGSEVGAETFFCSIFRTFRISRLISIIEKLTLYIIIRVTKLNTVVRFSVPVQPEKGLSRNRFDYYYS